MGTQGRGEALWAHGKYERRDDGGHLGEMRDDCGYSGERRGAVGTREIWEARRRWVLGRVERRWWVLGREATREM